MAQAKKWTAEQVPSQAGRRVVITGANSGIGWHTALELARKGAEVIIPARMQQKADDAIRRIRSEVPGAKLVPAILDLADQSSVRRFAEPFADGPIDLLINNAGVMALPKRELTVDGFERQFATNFLGPFALTALLLPAVLRTPNSRVVTVASSAANFGKIRFDNLQSELVYKPMFGTYSQSKLADLMFALELQRRLTASGAQTISTAAHPGYSVTNLQGDHLGAMDKFMTKLLKPFLSQSAAMGALPTLFAAVAPEAEAGGYYGPEGFQELTGYPTAAKIPDKAKDMAVAKKLWLASEKLTGVSFGELSAM